jgi:plastocyanin domain-containing protein
MKKLFSVIKILLAAIIVCFIAVSAAAQNKKTVPEVQKRTVVLRGGLYHPASLRLKRGVPAQLTIIRKSADECGEVIVFPAYGIRRRLPLNKAVVVRFTPRKTGSFGFMCGMDMMYGKIIVQ